MWHASRAIPRILLGAFALSILLVVPQAIEPVPAQAACGTRWDSRVVPPPTVRVYRTAKGRVDSVDFRRYVAIVMASGEWPASLPVAELEVGAVAVKQYAWYYALDGNHRSSYRTSSGVCYDVRDDTNDQLFHPERADPTPRQEGAVDRTWGLTLRKHGRFFLTGYRTGTATRCAADANGWKLYERSIRDCAGRLGWSRERIQQAYYAPGIEEVWASGISAPIAYSPVLRLDRGTTFPSQAATVSWAPAKSSSAITRYRLQRRVNGGAWKDIPLPAPLATQTSVGLWADRTHQFRVRARDEKGRIGVWATGPTLRAVLREPGQTELIGTEWEEARIAGATDGSTSVAETAGHRARLRFTGRSVGYLATMGPEMGRARILVNGREVAVVDLGAETERTRQLAWTRDWRRSKERTVVVEVMGPEGRVDLDAFLVIR